MDYHDCSSSAKRNKPNYKICGHCNKELSDKLYKEHKRLYYHVANKSWAKHISDGDDLSSSEFSSLDEFHLTVDDSMENADSTRPQEYDSDCNWEEPLAPPTENDTTDGKWYQGKFDNSLDLIMCVSVCEYYHFSSHCYKRLCAFIHAGVEFWIESDMEIDEDIVIEDASIPPPDVQESPENGELSIIVRWIVTLLSIFQTRFFLTNRALNWLLKLLSVLLTFLGRYSTKVAEVASASFTVQV